MDKPPDHRACFTTDAVIILAHMIIDAHTHFGLKSFSNGGTINDLARNGVEMAVAFIMDFISVRSPGRPEFWTERNKELAEVARRSQGKLIPFCTVYPGDGDAADREIRRAVAEDGARGIKLHPYFGLYPACSDDTARVSALAGELGLPIFFHCCFQPYVTPAQIALLAGEFPDTLYILGHSGWNNEWPVAMAVARRHENIFLCTSGLNFGGIGELIRKCDTARIVFGSDFPCGGPDSEVYEIEKIREHHCGAAIEEKIFHSNIARILNIKGFGHV
jgi:predicted TIM-barrel fold metal-dependent hydrolase